MTMASLEQKTQERLRQRGQQDQEWFRSMEEHPRCCLLPSPDILAVHGLANGSDETNTIDDFYNVLEWFRKIGCLNTEFYPQKLLDILNDKCHSIQKEVYGSLIQAAYYNAFAAMRLTAASHVDELVIWYYSGHGLPKDKLPNTVNSMPALGKVRLEESFNDIANQFLTKNPVVKGGELCLHHVGFCGLEGLLKPWIAAVKDASKNAPGQVKKNKHLLIILDSCYSGILAEDLQELNKKSGPWNENGCTVTVQAACGPDEVTFGGYFTPCFQFFNKAENQEKLDGLKDEWNKMDEEKREQFRQIQLPSPKLVTTRNLDETEETEPYVVLKKQNSKFILFKDQGFFKFCSLNNFMVEENILFDSNMERVLNQSTAAVFMNNQPFVVFDYKLKTLSTGPYAGNPMGMFLLEYPVKPGYAVCAHVHFAQDDTSKVGKINLVHHKAPPMGSIEYIEDHDGLSNTKVKKNEHKIGYAMVPNQDNAKKDVPRHWLMWDWKNGIPTGFPWPSGVNQASKEDEVRNGKELVKACHEFVEKDKPGRWNDVSQWDMNAKGQLSVKGHFRKRQRSAWMDKYLKIYYPDKYEKQPESTNVSE